MLLTMKYKDILNKNKFVIEYTKYTDNSIYIKVKKINF